ncbi:large ribosomal subunit protein bL21-like isoform X2 [Dysidea avara]|uniref:large ribosomal subunit protein bL21-like isoform X2 n=1 Tax=Dysidea avara TaxID=196820 RepID=UPI0033202B21
MVTRLRGSLRLSVCRISLVRQYSRSTTILPPCALRLLQGPLPPHPVTTIPSLCYASSANDVKGTLKTISEEIEIQPPSNLFAVVHISGRQFKVTKNDLIVIHRIPAEVGSQIVLEKVLLVASENFSLIGTPLLRKETVKVNATVVEHTRLAKVIIFKKKRRKGYKKKKGHRENVTTLRINDITIDVDAINN